MSIATPAAGVVGFGIQLRQVKKARLENDKLHLEIAALRQRAAEAERRIVLATNEEVQKITRGEVLFSLGRVGEQPEAPAKKLAQKLMEYLILVSVVALVGLFLAYLVYDLYRFTIWLWARL